MTSFETSMDFPWGFSCSKLYVTLTPGPNLNSSAHRAPNGPGLGLGRLEVIEPRSLGHLMVLGRCCCGVSLSFRVFRVENYVLTT